jgi:hypothetical protein
MFNKKNKKSRRMKLINYSETVNYGDEYYPYKYLEFFVKEDVVEFFKIKYELQ